MKGVLALLFVVPLLSFAQESAETPVPPAQPEVQPEIQAVAQPAAPVEVTASPEPVKRINREKEAEGSEAKNRFTQDPVVKSQYLVNGQALEVDPD